jgi:glycosyltransferase involved in cell wall biosynthesis
MQQPSVTVLIPCNATEYLFDCLASIGEQDYQQMNVLVILNGPAIDQLAKVQNAYKDYKHPIEFLVNSTAGIVSALNFGLIHSKSDYIARMDSDDLMPRGRIISQVTKFQNDDSIVCVGGQLEFFNVHSHSLHPGYPITDEEIRHRLYRYSPLPHPGVMYKKSSIERVGFYRDDFPYAEDWDLWLRLSKEGKICNLPVTTVIHRIHNQQSTKLFQSIQRESVRKLSLSTLNDVFFGPEKMPKEYKHVHKKFGFMDLACFLLTQKKPYRQTGVFGWRELRRALAGYLYVLGETNQSGGFHKNLTRFVIVCIDPKLLFQKFLSL